MNQYEQNQPQGVAVSFPATSSPYAAPPPAGYPTKDGANPPAAGAGGAVETRSRGDGFWKGCCAALCCCCVLDACF